MTCACCSQELRQVRIQDPEGRAFCSVLCLEAFLAQLPLLDAPKGVCPACLGNGWIIDRHADQWFIPCPRCKK